jgi:polo-like kinase 4
MCIKNSELEYRFEKLPSKLKVWYQYAYDFINIIKSKTPKIIYATDISKCYLMQNDPLPNLEVIFKDQLKEVKVITQVGSD